MAIINKPEQKLYVHGRPANNTFVMFAIQITYHYDPSVIIEGGHQVRVMEFFIGRFTNCRHEDAARSSMNRKAVALNR